MRGAGRAQLIVLVQQLFGQTIGPTCTGPRAALGPNYAYRTTTAADNENRQEPTTADNDNLSGPGQQQQQEDATAAVAVAVAAGARLAAACR